MKDLEEKTPKEALLLVQEKAHFDENERDEARRRGTRKEADLQDLLSFESCRSSAVD